MRGIIKSEIRNSKKYTLMDNLGHYTTAEEIREVILETIAAHGTIKLATINNQCANGANRIGITKFSWY